MTPVIFDEANKLCSLLVQYHACPIWYHILTRDPNCNFLITFYYFQWTYPIATPNSLRSKSNIHFPLSRSFQKIRPSPRPCVTLRNKVYFHCEELLAPRPTLKDHPLLALRDCLFNIFAAASVPGSRLLHLQTWGRVMLWWQGRTEHNQFCLILLNLISLMISDEEFKLWSSSLYNHIWAYITVFHLY
jgi:hypothetical protein